MVCNLDEVLTLVLHDVRNPVAVVIVPTRLATEEMLSAIGEVAEEYDQFVAQAPHISCRTLEEILHLIRATNEDSTQGGKPLT